MNKTFNQIGIDFYTERNFLKHKHFGKFAKITDSEKTIVELIKNIIYKQYYCIENQEHKELASNDFFSRLSLINADSKYLDNNWKVVEVLNKNLVKVKKNNISLTVDLKRDTYLSQNPEIDELIGVLFSCHYPNVSPGFYLFKGKKGDEFFTPNISRLYFNLKVEHAVFFIEKLINSLNENNIAFHFIVLQNLHNSERVDNSVLYFNAIDKEEVFDIVVQLQDENYFNPINSPFHFVLFPGIGYAEEPSEGKNSNESFGTHRSRIIAESIYSQLITEKARVICTKKIKMKFRQYNIDADKIYEQISLKL